MDNYVRIGASASQQQRYYLLSRLAAKENQSLVMLTATPHSGKPEEFQSLLGLLKPEYGTLDVANSTQPQRRDLARHFVQRKRADVEKWLGEDTPFPKRDPFEWSYNLSKEYAVFFDDILGFARKLVAPDPKSPKQRKRVQYWTALALLRGVMSSPAAGVKMLSTRLENLAASAVEGDDTTLLDSDESLGENPVADTEDFALADTAPTQLIEGGDWTEHQRKQLREFARRLDALSGEAHDAKLANLTAVLEDWIHEGFSPVVFCRYIATAIYLGEQLKPLLTKRFPKLDLQVVTSEDPDEIRKDRIQRMEGPKPRVLIATDCLSEGINLQDLFTGVLHYDLPWNPNRLEQREGRVDRFGQTAKVVKACLLYGADSRFVAVRRSSRKDPWLLRIYRGSKSNGECWPLAGWRRERNWKLTFSRQASVIQRTQAYWLRFSAHTAGAGPHHADLGAEIGRRGRDQDLRRDDQGDRRHGDGVARVPRHYLKPSIS